MNRRRARSRSALVPDHRGEVWGWGKCGGTLVVLRKPKNINIGHTGAKKMGYKKENMAGESLLGGQRTVPPQWLGDFDRHAYKFLAPPAVASGGREQEMEEDEYECEGENSDYSEDSDGDLVKPIALPMAMASRTTD